MGNGAPREYGNAGNGNRDNYPPTAEIGTEMGINSGGGDEKQEDLLYKAGMPNAKPMPTPLTSSLKFSSHGGEPFSKPALYRSLVGGLRYATITRPEISYAVNKVSQFMHCPLETHWKAAKQILRYLARTVHHDLRFQKSKDCRLYRFCDSDWGSDVDDRKSTSEFCVYLGLNLVSWSNRKQPVVFKSSTEAEYRSLAAGLTEII
ncbi:uncharacterized mitochondrial protein AtMg00810-like [Arachis duranensis]|uniref:Uncharacterized mitochondrial protein AtMg00810-like n=1 Tax=Arachis duranensis TaxID=130453 RepID=A0A6P5NRE1_ARADU|nr:uncharacterized mitochondrial protein AtMg00810-like [Arachis duranensis]